MQVQTTLFESVVPEPGTLRGYAARLASIDAGLMIAAFTLFVLGVMWAFVYGKAETERELTLGAAIKENGNLARAFEEHSVRTIRSADQLVLFVRDQYERHGRAFDLARYVAEGRIQSQTYNQIGVIDENGDYVLSSLKDFKPVNLSDREHFRVHVERDTGELFISRPVLGRASGKWSIQMSRRISRPDGSFGGVVVV